MTKVLHFVDNVMSEDPLENSRLQFLLGIEKVKGQKCSNLLSGRDCTITEAVGRHHQQKDHTAAPQLKVHNVYTTTQTSDMKMSRIMGVWQL